MPDLGWPELLIILVVALLLFGGTRLAGLGKSAGRSIREFKEETRGIREDEAKAKTKTGAVTDSVKGATSDTMADVVDAEVVQEHEKA
jgi:sec-independent protein translocase protein TatA